MTKNAIARGEGDCDCAYEHDYDYDYDYEHEHKHEHDYFGGKRQRFPWGAALDEPGSSGRTFSIG
jgi:hypothetical protein